MIKYLKWGVLGFGSASQNFIKTFDNSLSSTISSIASNSKYDFLIKNIENAEIFDNYEKLFKYGNVDIVYISAINSLHEKLVNLAIKYNKNILVEKPSCLSFFELNNLLTEIKKKKLFFKESILYLNHPITKVILEFIQSNEIGKVLKINASFGFNFAKKKLFFFKRKKKYKLNIFNKNLGGGALYNYAHYPFSALNIFTGNNEVLEIKDLLCNSFVGQTGVDEHVCLKLKFTNQLESIIELSINKNIDSFIEIRGENGYIYAKNPWIPGREFQIELNSRNRGGKIYNYVENRSLWSYEVESIENDISKGRSESTTVGAKPSDSLLYLKLIDKCRQEIFFKDK
tara:strand:+ start:90 stop:1118 length:1029 start_codon:yes stop_codon:yes gene_type:complete